MLDLGHLCFSSSFPRYSVNEASHDCPRYVERRAWDHQIDTVKPQCEQAFGATGQVLVELSRNGRLDCCIALLREQTVAARQKKSTGEMAEVLFPSEFFTLGFLI